MWALVTSLLDVVTNSTGHTSEYTKVVVCLETWW